MSWERVIAIDIDCYLALILIFSFKVRLFEYLIKSHTFLSSINLREGTIQREVMLGVHVVEVAINDVAVLRLLLQLRVRLCNFDAVSTGPQLHVIH